MKDTTRRTLELVVAFVLCTVLQVIASVLQDSAQGYPTDLSPSALLHQASRSALIVSVTYGLYRWTKIENGLLAWVIGTVVSALLFAAYVLGFAALNHLDYRPGPKFILICLRVGVIVASSIAGSIKLLDLILMKSKTKSRATTRVERSSRLDL